MKRISSTFSDELRATHPELIGKPFSWTADGEFTFDPSLTPAQIAAVMAVYEAHDPESNPLVAAAPVQIAAAFGIHIDGGDISAIDGTFNVLAALYLDVGRYVVFFLSALPEGYFVICQSDAPSVTIAEKNVNYTIVETRDAIGGAPVEASRLDVLCYRIEERE